MPDALTPEAAAGQVIIAGFPGTALDPQIRTALREGGLGGVILFARNLGGIEDVWALCREVRDLAPAELAPWICVDQEGGRVARLKAPVVALPPMRRLGELDDVSLTERAGAVLGRELRAIGFSTDFAPVLDVDTNPANPVIGDRAFGRDAARVTRHGLAFADGLASAGIIACGKHFPGHGDTDLDSHLALPRVQHPRARLDEVELAPFRAARGRIPSLMTAHVVFDALDPGVPATLSEKVVGALLRGELGYDGVVVSDDLEMKAVSERMGIAASAVGAIRAGCDALLVCSRVDWALEARDALAAEARRDAPFRARLLDAADRGLALRRRHAPAPAADREALHAAMGTAEARALRESLDARLASAAAAR